MESLVRVQTEEDQPPLAAQLAEEIEHEADVAVLGVELRLVEQVHHRVVAARRLEQEIGLAAPEAPHLVGLVVVDGKPVALARLDVVDVLPRADHAPSARRVRARRADGTRTGRSSRRAVPAFTRLVGSGDVLECHALPSGAAKRLDVPIDRIGELGAVPVLQRQIGVA